MPKKPKVKWANSVKVSDLAGAKAYLTLKFNSNLAIEALDQLSKGPIQVRRADDILRASGLQPLRADDPGVLREFSRMAAGKTIQPVLLISTPDCVDIANGYHRCSAAYHLDPNEPVNCVIAEVTTSEADN